MCERNQNQTMLHTLFKKHYNQLEPSKETNLQTDDTTTLHYLTSFIETHPDILLVFSLDGQVISKSKNEIYEYLGYRKNHNNNIEDLLSQETYATF